MFPRLLQATLNATVTVPGAKLWSIPRPYLYVLVSEVISASGAVLDQVNTTVGFRSLNYTGDEGFFMVGISASPTTRCPRCSPSPRPSARCSSQLHPLYHEAWTRPLKLSNCQSFALHHNTPFSSQNDNHVKIRGFCV